MKEICGLPGHLLRECQSSVVSTACCAGVMQSVVCWNAMQEPPCDPSFFGNPADTAHLPRDRAAFLAYCRFFTDSSILRESLPAHGTGQQVLCLLQVWFSFFLYSLCDEIPTEHARCFMRCGNAPYVHRVAKVDWTLRDK